MSADEPFFARWSREKRATNGKESAKKRRSSAQPVAPATKPFDVATLPPIESITELTDITAFLQQGVPAELTRAALRRVWTADPAIRDFVGLAENAWDFTDPTAMPGFGPLESTEEMRRIVARMVEQIGKAAQPADPEGAVRHLQVAENSSDSSVINDAGAAAPSAPSGSLRAVEASPETAEKLGSHVMLRGTRGNSAAQHDQREAEEKPEQLSRRTHGGALPR